MNRYPKPKNNADAKKLMKIIRGRNTTDGQKLDAAERILDAAYGPLPTPTNTTGQEDHRVARTPVR
jgi:hypothetical protein